MKLVDKLIKVRQSQNDFFQAEDSSKKQTNEFDYDTSVQLVFVRFLEEIEYTKRHFEINWPLG